MPADVTVELFRSANLAVRQQAGFSAACCVVTFDSFSDHRTLDRPGFGEAFFRSRGIDAIHVLSAENDWYQYPEMEAAMLPVHIATRGYRRVVTYGSSMGGYAAIRLAGLAGAHCALALSPQFSVDPSVVQFERRWRETSERFKPVWEQRLPLPVLDEAYLVYDPQDLDGWHAALFQPAFSFTSVPLPQAGHTVSGYLQEVGLLQDLVLAVCHGTFDAGALVAEAWRRRERSPQHLVARAEQSRDPAERLGLLEAAVRMAPTQVACVSSLAMELSRAGRFAEALAWHRTAIAMDPTHPGRLILYVNTLEKSGDYAGALAALEQVVATAGSNPPLLGRLQGLRKRLTAGERAGRRRDAWRRRLRAAAWLNRRLDHDLLDHARLD